MQATTEVKQSRRERARQVGMSGNYWYAAELAENVRRGEVKEVVFWRTSIALFRGEDGEVRAVENRCAHRQLRLSSGRVEGNLLVCSYHGWKYDGCGKCVEISHELGPRTKQPNIRIRTYPVRIKYGFVWIFPGDPERAEHVPLPHIPQLEGSDPWPFEPIDVTIKSHFSMVVENVCDFNHAYLHRRYKPFTRPKMEGYRREGDSISVDYDTAFGDSKIAQAFSERGAKDLNKIRLWYDYPYQRSTIQGRYHHWLFMLPVDEETTRCFFVFLFDRFVIPGVRVPMPGVLRKMVLKAATVLYIRPLLGEDQWALEEEQIAHREHADKPSYEFNPIVQAFQKMTIDKWDEYVEEERQRVASLPLRQQLASIGAGVSRQDLSRQAAHQVEQLTDGMSDAPAAE